MSVMKNSRVKLEAIDVTCAIMIGVKRVCFKIAENDFYFIFLNFNHKNNYFNIKCKTLIRLFSVLIQFKI